MDAEQKIRELEMRIAEIEMQIGGDLGINEQLEDMHARHEQLHTEFKLKGEDDYPFESWIGHTDNSRLYIGHGYMIGGRDNYITSIAPMAGGSISAGDIIVGGGCGAWDADLSKSGVCVLEWPYTGVWTWENYIDCNSTNSYWRTVSGTELPPHTGTFDQLPAGDYVIYMDLFVNPNDGYFYADPDNNPYIAAVLESDFQACTRTMLAWEILCRATVVVTNGVARWTNLKKWQHQDIRTPVSRMCVFSGATGLATYTAPSVLASTVTRNFLTTLEPIDGEAFTLMLGSVDNVGLLGQYNRFLRDNSVYVASWLVDPLVHIYT